MPGNRVDSFVLCLPYQLESKPIRVRALCNNSCITVSIPQDWILCLKIHHLHLPFHLGKCWEDWLGHGCSIDHMQWRALNNIQYIQVICLMHSLHEGVLILYVETPPWNRTLTYEERQTYHDKCLTTVLQKGVIHWILMQVLLKRRWVFFFSYFPTQCKQQFRSLGS